MNKDCTEGKSFSANLQIIKIFYIMKGIKKWKIMKLLYLKTAKYLQI